jgi:hypothetical protein
MHIDYWWESQKEIGHLKEHDVGWWIILKRILECYGGVVWTGFISFRIGTSGGLKLNTFIHLTGSRTGDLLACSTVPQPLHYCLHPIAHITLLIIICLKV